MENDYSITTCNEIAEILDHIPKNLYDKLPREIINYFYQNSDENLQKFKYNVALPILNQNISQESKEIVLFLFRIFWQDEIKSTKMNQNKTRGELT